MAVCSNLSSLRFTNFELLGLYLAPVKHEAQEMAELISWKQILPVLNRSYDEHK